MNSPQFLPIGKEQIDLLEKLSNACAVSGNEGEIRRIIKAELAQTATTMRVDMMGNLLVTRQGSSSHRLRVMLAAHMDEVGFMLVADEGEGSYRFETVGGVDPRWLIGKPVLAGKDHIPGVIGANPIHLAEPGELHHTKEVRALRMDFGPEAADKVQPGDWVTFATRFSVNGPSLMGKALDDRLGIATLIELIKHTPENVDLLVAFTVQEEVGARGARAAAFNLKPDVAFVLDSTPAYELPIWDDSENTTYNTRLGDGPAIYISDSGTISDPRLIRHLTRTAESHQIPFQFRQSGGGGTDASAIHKQMEGIPSISISVPGRYAHSPVMVARLEDWQNTLNLLFHALESITPAVLDRG
jgi:tetrahedral aminopeptidase